MACNSCAKPFSMLRKEKGCPSCGFSYCSKCLTGKVFLPKLNSEVKVCPKCKKLPTSDNEPKQIEPPDAYYRRIGAAEDKAISSKSLNNNSENNIKDQQILDRLTKLKQDKPEGRATAEEEIARRLQNIKGDIPSTSDTELHLRLAKLKGIPEVLPQHKPALAEKDLRSEQEQVDDLMKQYLEQTNIDAKYKEEFDELVSDIESRMQKLKGSTGPSGVQSKAERVPGNENTESEDEEDIVKKIVEKVKTEASMEDHISSPTNDELPFCEICNEDAKMRCLGCKYLFCKRCFLEHKDDDDGCDRYEPYEPPKGYVH